MRRELFACLAVVATSLALAASFGLQGCAHAIAPRGGPPDTTPPVLLLVGPDSFSVTDFRGGDGAVRFEFDEPISERNIRGVALVYPFDRRPRVDKGKRELKVRPRTGWVEDRIYHIRIETQLQDYFNNRIPMPIEHVISTGLPIPDNRIRGVIYDRITGEVHRTARVDAVRLPDTLRYGTPADTAGLFTLAWLPPGDYLAIGYEDGNGNLKADEFDRSDTVRVSLAAEDTLTLEFRVFKHDTLGPVLSEIELLDSMTVSLGFSGYLDPEAPAGAGNVELLSLPDSTPLAVDTVLHYWSYEVYRDSVRAAERARRDSLAAAEAAAEAAAAEAAADTAADTAAAPLQAPEPAPPEPAPPEPAPGRQDRAVEPEAQEAEVPRPLPDRRIVVFTATPIAPGTYLVRVSDIVNLSGLSGRSELEFVREAPEEDEGVEEEPPGGPPEPDGGPEEDAR